MPTTVDVKFNTQQILNSRGLGADNKAQKFFCNEVFRLSEPYTPFDQGMLKSNVVMAADGSSLTYNSIYARYQWYGKVMVGKAKKQATDKSLIYAGAPLRGSQWTNRMWSSRGKEIINSVAKLVGGKA